MTEFNVEFDSVHYVSGDPDCEIIVQEHNSSDQSHIDIRNLIKDLDLSKLDASKLPEVIKVALTQAKESGEFDGYSPTIDVQEIEEGYRITITDSVDTQSFIISHGKDGVATIKFAGVTLTEEEDGVFTIDQKSARQALGFNVPEGSEGQEITLATEESVSSMSKELKAYVDEQVANSRSDYGEI